MIDRFIVTENMEIRDLYIKCKAWNGIHVSTVERENLSTLLRETLSQGWDESHFQPEVRNNEIYDNAELI